MSGSGNVLLGVSLYSRRVRAARPERSRFARVCVKCAEWAWSFCGWQRLEPLSRRLAALVLGVCVTYTGRCCNVIYGSKPREVELLNDTEVCTGQLLCDAEVRSVEWCNGELLHGKQKCSGEVFNGTVMWWRTVAW